MTANAAGLGLRACCEITLYLEASFQQAKASLEVDSLGVSHKVRLSALLREEMRCLCWQQ